MRGGLNFRQLDVFDNRELRQTNILANEYMVYLSNLLQLAEELWSCTVVKGMLQMEEFLDTVLLVVFVLIARFLLFLGDSFDTFFVVVQVWLNRWKLRTFLLQCIKLVFGFLLVVIVIVFFFFLVVVVLLLFLFSSFVNFNRCRNLFNWLYYYIENGDKLMLVLVRFKSDKTQQVPSNSPIEIPLRNSN